MESKENPIFGRKVFFLNPSLVVQNVIVERLRIMEYEVYTIADYKDGKLLLSENENAICFINIDDQLPLKSWFNYVKSFEFDSSLESIFIGVLSAKAKISEREQFLMKIKLPGGFVNMNDNIETVFSTIEKILDLNGAKGRRKFVRLNCYGMGNIFANCAIHDRLIDLKIDDVSTAGFAARCSLKAAAIFQKGVNYRISLQLGVKSVFVEANVFAAKQNEKDETIVFMLDQITPPRIKDDIRKFISKALQDGMDSLIDSSIKDMIDYSVDIKIPEHKQVELLSVDDIKFDDFGDLESIES